MKFIKGCFSLILSLIGLLFLVGFVMNLFVPNDEPKNVKDGEMGVIVSGNLVAINKEANDLLSSYSKAENIEGIKSMRAHGEAFWIDRGEKVHVIDYGVFSSYIEVVETGQRGYIDTHSVKSKMYE